MVNKLATNIVLQGLPPDFYALVNHHKIAKDIWYKVKLLMQGTSLSSWQYLHTLNYYQLYAYLEQHEAHANEACLMHERFPNPLALVANYHPQPYHTSTTTFFRHKPLLRITILHTPILQYVYSPSSQSNPYGAPHHPQQYPTTYPTNLSHTQPSVTQNAYPPPIIPQQPQVEFPQIDSGLAVPTFLLDDDPIACLQGNASGSRGNTSGQAKIIKCYSCQGEGHMARQCTQPKRRKDATWFKEKVLLVQAQAEGKILDEEQLAFLAVPRVVDGQVAQTITHNVAFQTDDLDAYASDCDDISSAKAVLMANLSSCDSDVLSEITSDSNIIPYSQYLEEMQQDKANNESKIVNESLTAELERYKERVKNFKQRFKVDLSSLENFIDSQMDDMIPMKNTKFAAIETEIDTLKQTLSKHVKEKESLLTTLNGFKIEFKERESKSINKEIVLENKNTELEDIVCKLYQSTQAMHMLTKPQVFYDNTHKQALGYQNPFYLKRAQGIKPILYDGNVLSKTYDVLSVVVFLGKGLPR
ncbi:integrase, catalytic region, zinc finger, CCHC-type containing protein [Tanacetum coccineum]